MMNSPAKRKEFLKTYFKQKYFTKIWYLSQNKKYPKAAMKVTVNGYLFVLVYRTDLKRCFMYNHH